jgi:N-acetylglucosamine malate deacetylase 2
MTPDFIRLEPALIVAAHPDDETIGFGGQFGEVRDTYIIHVTDGAPRSTPGRAEYAAERRCELAAAMDLARVQPSRCFELGAPDQESSFSLRSLTRMLWARLSEIQPKVIFTHPYEGGHPDHDACAFIVQAAVDMIRSGRAPMRVEFTSYHNGTPHSDCGSMKVGEFLPGPPVCTIPLSPSARQLKRRMFECFQTQQHILKEFPVGEERFRVAPHYDFSIPPHPGKLYYEDQDWALRSGAEWRRLVLDASKSKGVAGSR